MSHELILDAVPHGYPRRLYRRARHRRAQGARRKASSTEPPAVLDTYAVLYALSLVFLVPGALSIANLAFRDYTFAYVSLVTVPFLLGLLATLFTDSREPIKTLLIRAAVLVPIIVLTGVTVLFTSSFIVLPISQVLTPKSFDIAGPIAMVSLIVLALPLVPALIRRVRLPAGMAQRGAHHGDPVRNRGRGRRDRADAAPGPDACHHAAQGRHDLHHRRLGLVSAVVRYLGWRLEAGRARLRLAVSPQTAFL